MPWSRIHDGICDCCDGADEEPGLCEDNCAEILAAERARKERIQRAYTLGAAKRMEAVQNFAQLQKEVEVQLQQVDRTIANIQDRLSETKQLMQTAKERYYNERVQALEERMYAIGTSKVTGQPIEARISNLLEPLTNEELIEFILHLCQMSGELSDSYGPTCVPLRLAGIDAGVVWETKTYQLVRPSITLLADLTEYNIKHAGNKVWNANMLEQGANKKHRRLMEENDYAEEEYPYVEDDPDDFEDSFADEQVVPPEEEEDNGSSDDSSESKRQELLKVIQNKSFSWSRIKFIERSEALIAKIKNITDLPVDDTEDEESENQSEIDGEGVAAFDPVALPMVRSKLEERLGRIRRGFDYAASARVLLESVESYEYAKPEDLRTDLLRLAMSTLHYSRLSAVHVWQILHHIVPELSIQIPTEDEATCQSPWAGICPPQSVSRNVGSKSVDFPPSSILEAARSYCESHIGEDIQHVCASSDSIPVEVPDGYFGYNEIKHRAEDDIFSEAFQDLDLTVVDEKRALLNELEEKVQNLQGDLNAAERKRNDLYESIGGDEGTTKFGPDGELHILKDSCHIVEEGKYEYEVCLFGSAKQRDKGQTGGTDLGRWAGASIDEASGERIWKWDKGVKCWNGPQRSATAYVTCGSETKVLSADEPDTCRYVLQVESPVACDDAYRARAGL